MKITRALIDEMSSRYRATLINSIEGFKSLNLIGTRCISGVSNLAPFNSIVHIGSNPPLIGFIARPETEEHQTLKNIRETGWYTINQVHEGIYKAAHQTSAKYDASTSEFNACGFTEQHSKLSSAPYVLESRVKYMLQLKEIIPIALNNTSLVIGEIHEIEIDDCTIETDGFVHLEELGSMTCVGVDAYFNVSLKERLAYAKK
jgi:flavin reductase (DIM6/NTAB) family NADH-FMN oxidoreductase RutF